jgi:hypothetical protein
MEFRGFLLTKWGAGSDAATSPLGLWGRDVSLLAGPALLYWKEQDPKGPGSSGETISSERRRFRTAARGLYVDII